MQAATHKQAAATGGQRGRAERKDGYARRRPEDSALYQFVAEHWPGFKERMERHGGLPKFVRDEFDAYLGCGRLEAGWQSAARCGAAPVSGDWSITATGRRREMLRLVRGHHEDNDPSRALPYRSRAIISPPALGSPLTKKRPTVGDSHGRRPRT